MAWGFLASFLQLVSRFPTQDSREFIHIPHLPVASPQNLKFDTVLLHRVSTGAWGIGKRDQKVTCTRELSSKTDLETVIDVRRGRGRGAGAESVSVDGQE